MRDKTYWILDREQVACLSSTVRMDMLDRLSVSGPKSIKELSEETGMKPTALYRHIKKLLTVGLVHEQGFRIVNRRKEIIYKTPSNRMRMRRALADQSCSNEIKAVVSALCRQIDRDFSSNLGEDQSVTDGHQRNLGFFRVIGAPNRLALKKINALLTEVGEILWNEHSKDAPLVSISWIMTPMKRKDSH